MRKQIAFLLIALMFISLMKINVFAINNNYIDDYVVVPDNTILFESGLINERFGTSAHAPNSDYWFIDGTDLVIPLQKNINSGYQFKIALDNAEWMFQNDIQSGLPTFNTVRGSLNGGIYTRNTSNLSSLVGKDITQPKTIINGIAYSEGRYSLSFSLKDNRVAVATVLQNYSCNDNIIFRIPIVTFIKNASKAVFVIVDVGGSAGVSPYIHAFMIPSGKNIPEQVDWSRWQAEADAWAPKSFIIPSPATSSTTAGRTMDKNVPLNGEILINGNTIQAPAPYIKGDKDNVMVPLRAVAEQLGITVTWNEMEQSVDIGAEMHIFIGKDYCIIGDGDPVTLSSPPEISAGFTYVPLSFFQDVLTGYLAYIKNDRVLIENRVKTTTKLPVIEVRENPVTYNPSTNRVKYDYSNPNIVGSFISPSEGITISAAEDLIIKNLIQKDVPGPIKSSIKVTEITTVQAWGVNKMQFFFAEIDYRATHYIAVFQEGKLTGIYSGNYFQAIYLADLNNDGKYEIIVNDQVGFGYISFHIKVFDVENLKEYELQQRGENDFLLAISETRNNLIVYKGLLHSREPKISLAGRLLLRDNLLIVEDDMGKIVLTDETNKR